MRRLVKRLIGESDEIEDFAARSFVSGYKSRLGPVHNLSLNSAHPPGMLAIVLKLGPPVGCATRIALECAKLVVAREENSDKRALLASRLETAEGWLKAGKVDNYTRHVFGKVDNSHVSSAVHNACTSVLLATGNGYEPDADLYARSAVQSAHYTGNGSGMNRIIIDIASEYLPYFNYLCGK